MAMPLGARCPGGRSRQNFWIGSLVGGQIPRIGHRQRDILLRNGCPAFSGLHGAEQGGNAEDVDGSPQVVGERRQAKLGVDVGEPAHEERTLVHPLID